MSSQQPAYRPASLFATAAPGWSILVRLLAGLAVFFPEGIQKLIFPDILGAGRFANIGIPYPEAMGPFAGIVEIICGALIILGLFTRLAAIPLIAIMIVAIVSTKVPILLGDELISRFDGRLLSIDEQIAQTWGRIVASCTAMGRPIGIMDGFIAATAAEHKLTLVTRNGAHFANAKISLLNPWSLSG